MSRTKLLASSLLVLLLSACGPHEDVVLRAWASRMDQWAADIHRWDSVVVFPALVAYCELERHVYDDFHGGVLTPVNRYCPPGGTDPILPPAPPPGWDD
jgi:hypothetical protein